MESGIKHFTMVTIDKTNDKPDDAFFELYKRANPTPGATPKVPVLHIVIKTEEDEVTEEIVLCESRVIIEFIDAALTTRDDDEHDSNHSQLLQPTSSPTICDAKIRLFAELCGSSTFLFVPFTRVQNAQQVEDEFNKLQEQMIKVNAFLVAAAAAPWHPSENARSSNVVVVVSFSLVIINSHWPKSSWLQYEALGFTTSKV
jgi:hypothetical protein